MTLVDEVSKTSPVVFTSLASAVVDIKREVPAVSCKLIKVNAQRLALRAQ